MPRIGAEPERRKALINAAIDMIGDHGSLDVPVKEIASRAGMSPALAFHYFGGKDAIITETMRHLLREFTVSVLDGLRRAETPSQRLDAIISASISPQQFDRKTVAAWLVFYLHAYSSPPAARLLGIYRWRLNSNLVSTLLDLVEREQAERAAAGLGALIDGLYIRHGLDPEGPDSETAIALCRDYLACVLERQHRPEHTTTGLH